MVELSTQGPLNPAGSRVSWKDALSAYSETKESGFALLPSLNRRAIVSRFKQRRGESGRPNGFQSFSFLGLLTGHPKT